MVPAPRMLPRILTPAEVDALTGALRTHRDRAMVAAMVLGGLRRCEVLGLRLGDLQVAQRRVFIANGKGGHQRLIPIAGRFFTHVAVYLEQERPADADTDVLFVVLKRPRRGQPSRRTVWTRSSMVPVRGLVWRTRRVTSCGTRA